jgi:hypothetical protein
MKKETFGQIDQTNPVTRGSTALVYKEETLEDAAQSYAVNQRNRTSHYMGFIQGAKWMEKKMENLKDFDTWKEWKNENK